MGHQFDKLTSQPKHPPDSTEKPEGRKKKTLHSILRLPPGELQGEPELQGDL